MSDVSLPPQHLSLPAGAEALALLWRGVLGDLSGKLTRAGYETWISPMRLLAVAPDKVTLAVECEFNRDWILKKYRALLTEAFSARLDRLVVVEIDVAPLTAEEQALAAARPPLENEVADPAGVLIDEIHAPKELALPGSQLYLSAAHAALSQPRRVWTPRVVQSNLNPRYTFDAFVVGPGNRFCHVAAQAVAETPAQNYNPFFIHGPSGMGKTHLMQAVAHFAMAAHGELSVRYVTAEQFTNELVSSLAAKNMKSFRDRYRKNDILMIDDVQFLEGKERTQEEVFHTFNALHESGKQIILSSDRSPKSLSQLEERLRSRFEWGLIADIQPADFDTRLEILRNKARRERLNLPEAVLGLIAESFTRNIRELEGALNKVAAYAVFAQTLIDEEMARGILGLDLQAGRSVSPGEIIEGVARFYHLTPGDLKGPSRAKDVAHARQVAIYVLRNLTEASFPKIGGWLGDRKHTTILYAYEKMKQALEQHPSLANQVRDLTSRL